MLCSSLAGEALEIMVAQYWRQFIIWIEPAVVAAAHDIRRFAIAVADALCNRRQQVDTRPIAARSCRDRAIAAGKRPPR